MSAFRNRLRDEIDCSSAALASDAGVTSRVVEEWLLKIRFENLVSKKLNLTSLVYTGLEIRKACRQPVSTSMTSHLLIHPPPDKFYNRIIIK